MFKRNDARLVDTRGGKCNFSLVCSTGYNQPRPPSSAVFIPCSSPPFAFHRRANPRRRPIPKRNLSAVRLSADYPLNYKLTRKMKREARQGERRLKYRFPFLSSRSPLIIARRFSSRLRPPRSFYISSPVSSRLFPLRSPDAPASLGPPTFRPLCGSLAILLSGFLFRRPIVPRTFVP